jgi:hypothetical protein
MTPQETGFKIQSRIPFASEEWEDDKTVPRNGKMTQNEALKMASAIVKSTPNFGVEIQWRVIDANGIEIARESSRSKNN